MLGFIGAKIVVSIWSAEVKLLEVRSGVLGFSGIGLELVRASSLAIG